MFSKTPKRKMRNVISDTRKKQDIKAIDVPADQYVIDPSGFSRFPLLLQKTLLATHS